MTYVAPFDMWNPRSNHVAALPPSPGDLLCITTLLGRKVFVDPVTAYDAAVRRAHVFARRVVHPVPVVIKVLCLTFPEAQALGLAPLDLFRDQTAEQDADMRALAISACHDALQRSSDAKVRADAIQLLKDLGVMT